MGSTDPSVVLPNNDIGCKELTCEVAGSGKAPKFDSSSHSMSLLGSVTEICNIINEIQDKKDNNIICGLVTCHMHTE